MKLGFPIPLSLTGPQGLKTEHLPQGHVKGGPVPARRAERHQHRTPGRVSSDLGCGKNEVMAVQAQRSNSGVGSQLHKRVLIYPFPFPRDCPQTGQVEVWEGAPQARSAGVGLTQGFVKALCSGHGGSAGPTPTRTRSGPLTVRPPSLAPASFQGVLFSR